jgi:hypothetical protein
MFRLLDVHTRLRLVELARMNGRKLRWIGGALCAFAAITPWLMVLRLVRTTYWLSFLTYGALVLGMGLSLVGIIYDNFANLER